VKGLGQQLYDTNPQIALRRIAAGGESDIGKQGTQQHQAGGSAIDGQKIARCINFTGHATPP